MSGVGPSITTNFDDEKALQDKLLNEHKELMRQNIAKTRELMQGYMPVSGPGEQGALEKVAYQAGLTPEGQVGEILTKMIASVLMAIFGTHYWVQHSFFNDAKLKGTAYIPGDDGKYPPIRLIDSQGNPYGEALNNEAITRDLIRQNGLVPPPSYEESWLSSWDTYQAFMSGPNSLTDEQKRRTLLVGGDVYSKGYDQSQTNTQQKAYDSMMANKAAQPKPPAPKP